MDGYMKLFILLLSIAFFNSCLTCKVGQDLIAKKACVLYTTLSDKTPMRKYSCKEVKQDQVCDYSLINAKGFKGKLWREYLHKKCNSVDLRETLSQKYLLEGKD